MKKNCWKATVLLINTVENQVVIKVYFLSWFLKESVLLESTTGVGSEFHGAITRLENKNFCTLVLMTGTVIFSGWPRKFLFGFKVKKSLLIETLSCSMQYVVCHCEVSDQTSVLKTL